MAWFPCSKSGGGIKKGNILSSQVAAPGQDGYINFARIKILDNYANHTCYFTIQNRGIYFPIILSLGFQNINHTDPGLNSFLYWGATDYGIYAVKNTTSTWYLYVKKTEVHDEVEILSLNYNTRYIDVTFPCGFAAEKGEGWMSPQPGGRVAGAGHVYDSDNGADITFSYAKPGMTRDGITWLACWDGYEMRAINKNVFTYLKKLDHYGMCIPYEDGAGQNDQEWIRTTNNGIIPYSANSSEGKSSLGTETWPFANCYAKKIVTNEIFGDIFNYAPNLSTRARIMVAENYITFTCENNPSVGIGMQVNTSKGYISIHPLGNTSANLGAIGRLWTDIYARNATIQTSDRNQKKDISYIGEESEYENTKMSNETLVKFIMALKACIFLRKDGESGRPHHGFISQDFKKAMDETGITDHAAYIKSPKTEMVEKEVEQEREVYDEVEKKTKIVKETVKIQKEKVIEGEFNEGLRYEEIISDLTRFCQILYQQNQEQQKKIESLENRVNMLENIIKQGA